MTTSDQFPIALQAYQEILDELHQEGQLQPQARPALPLTGFIPKLDTPESRSDSLPCGSLLLGLAEDGLPLLLDLYDPHPGPLLVAGDGGSGKTAFLQSLARATNLQDPGDLQFGVLSPFPEEWAGLETMPQCLGVWPAYHPSAAAFLSQLTNWAQVLGGTHQALILLFDGFDLLTAGEMHSDHDLRWLLMYGPERHIWPVLSINPARLARLQTWLEYFHTRVFGRVKHMHNACYLVDNPQQVNLGELISGSQFCLSQPGSWLKFWLPPLE